MKCDLICCAGVEEVYFCIKDKYTWQHESQYIPLAETDSELEAAFSRSAIDNILFAIAKNRKQEILRHVYGRTDTC
jgi:hypothetical protein